MRWRDIRFEKPTTADEDKAGRVLAQYADGTVLAAFPKHIGVAVAWMPMSELPKFIALPEPPEGYRYKIKEDVFTSKAKCWCEESGKWVITMQREQYAPHDIYCVPIELTYRPFVSAEEFAPHFNRPVDRRDHENEQVPGAWRFSGYDDVRVFCGNTEHTYYELFTKQHHFADGDKEPFGVKV